MAPNTATAQVPIETLRSGFLKKAILRSQKIPRQNYSTGGQIQFRLPHAGFGNYVIIDFQGQIVVGGAAGSAKLSDKGPYNLMNIVSFDDYLGINRIYCQGFDLHERLLSLKYFFDESNSGLAAAYASNRYNASIGGGVGATGTYPLNFSLVVPIALHENTTEASFPFTIPNGDNTITLTFNTETGATNDQFIKVTTGGWTFTITGSVGATYYYWDVPAGVALPVADFALVHELRRVQETTGLSAGGDKRYTLRTGRSYYQIIENLRLADAGDTTDVSEIALYVDGNTPTMDEYSMPYLTRIYNKFGRDLPPGMFLWDFWRKPWTPNDYGSIETSLILSNSASVTGNSYVSIFMESMYQTSKILSDLAAMPGAQQA